MGRLTVDDGDRDGDVKMIEIETKAEEVNALSKKF